MQDDDGTGLPEVLAVVDALTAAGARFWITGGRGVDVLVGRTTRPHRDLDLDVDADQEARVLQTLAALGYAIETDERPTRVELLAVGGGRVDVHPVHLDAAGDATQQAPDGTVWRWPRRYFTAGVLEGRAVGCYTPEGQRFFRTGYDPRPQDVADLARLEEHDPPGQRGP